ncbi:MAG: ABC transporter ATP-binding protein [Deltaproteobacteria bacterium]|nr:ABC transporter ATP-binding protein [Deltaproteobacteria bacterium]
MEVSLSTIDSIAAETHNANKLVPAVDVNTLSFSYKERRALDGLSFTIERGEIFGLLGPNGSGKTTLFKLLSTLLPLQKGEARILGYDLRADTAALRRRIGVVFQHPSVDRKLTVSENLMHHGHLYGLKGESLRERSAAMLRWLGLSERADDLVETLSGGLQRRVELAKAFLHQPELLILDEPSTGLDPSARREFLYYVSHLRDEQGVTIVLTTHYMEEAERCDRLGILHEGKLVALAPPPELKSHVGGDVVVINATNAETLRQQIQLRMRTQAALVGGSLRIERPRGHEFVRDVVEAFGEQIESITFGKPTLEDVFVHLTGHHFYGGKEEGQ